MEEHLSYDLEAEKAVLGALLIDDEKIKQVREILSNEDFYDKRHAYIFRGMEYLDNNGSGIDLLTLTNALKKK